MVFLKGIALSLLANKPACEKTLSFLTSALVDSDK